MDDTTLRKIQLTQLEIAKEIKRVCEENHIQYFLVGGTLIGAIRHKGFIPWDDDLDFGMHRREYERFISIAPVKLNKKYFLQTWHTDEEYGYAFAKVRKIGTIFVEANDSSEKKHQEVYVDVFPYDNLPEKDIGKKRHIKRIRHYRELMRMVNKMTVWRRQPTTIRRILKWVTCLPNIIESRFVDRKKMIKKYEVEMNRYNDSETELIAQESGGVPFGKYPVRAEYIKQKVMLPFEDDEFACPFNYDAFLRDIYGDYLKLPPLEKQKCTHQIISLKL